MAKHNVLVGCSKSRQRKAIITALCCWRSSDDDRFMVDYGSHSKCTQAVR